MDDGLVLQRLERALNANDLDAFLECFDDDYDSAQPLHPGRRFRGVEQVRKNWGALFGAYRVRAKLVDALRDGEREWGEWEIEGNAEEGGRFLWRGVMLMRVEDERFAAGRLYLENVAEEEESIDEAIEKRVAAAGDASR